MSLDPALLIKAKRESRNLSIKKASDISGISRKRIRAFECNDYKRSSTALNEYIDFLFPEEFTEIKSLVAIYLGEKSDYEKQVKEGQDSHNQAQSNYVVSIEIEQSNPYDYQIYIYDKVYFENGDEDLGSLVCTIDHQNGLRFCTREIVSMGDDLDNYSVLAEPIYRFTNGSNSKGDESIELFLQYCQKCKTDPIALLKVVGNVVSVSSLFTREDSIRSPRPLLEEALEALSSDDVDHQKNNRLIRNIKKVCMTKKKLIEVKLNLLKATQDIANYISFTAE